VLGKIALAIDKRATMILFFIIAAVGMCIMRAVGISVMPEVLLYIVLVCCCTCVYWDIMPSIYYDICEYDELVTGHSRQGTIVSFQGLVEAVALGLGSLILGLLLQFAGFDGKAATQTLEAQSWIFNCTTVVPVLFLLASCIAIYKYPITKEVHEDIRRKLNDRQK
jgi:GPH family glycoside/pentoside/hexuronide:cation symporter